MSGTIIFAVVFAASAWADHSGEHHHGGSHQHASGGGGKAGSGPHAGSGHRAGPGGPAPGSQPARVYHHHGSSLQPGEVRHAHPAPGEQRAQPQRRPDQARAHDLPRHSRVVRNKPLIDSIRSKQREENTPGRYYRHTVGRNRYVHYQDKGVHWYGFYRGSHFYWTRWHEGHWWHYDGAKSRWVYWWSGHWWWQGPSNVVYVYVNDDYQPYPAPAVPAVTVVPVGEADVAPPTAPPAPLDQAPMFESSYEVQVGTHPSSAIDDIPGPPPMATPPSGNILPPPPPEPGDDDTLPGEF